MSGYVRKKAAKQPVILTNVQKKRQTGQMSAWLVDWIDTHYPPKTYGAKLDREAIRRESWDDLPRKFLPVVEELQWSWWMKKTQHILNRNGYALLDGSRGKLVGRKWMLSWPDMQAYLVGKLRLTESDQEAVLEDLREWCKQNGVAMDINKTMKQLRKAAGLI